MVDEGDGNLRFHKGTRIYFCNNARVAKERLNLVDEDRN